MKNILCFGDSNTYGFNPKNGGRYNSETRWCSILKTALNSKFNVIEQGCNNRTAFSKNPDGIEYIGIGILSRYLTSDINYLVLNIGVNDLQFKYKNDVNSLEIGICLLIQKAYELNPNAKILVLSPPRITSDILNSFFASMFDKNSIKLSCELYSIFKRVSEKYNCDLINLDEIISVSEIDGLHYDIEAHDKIAQVLVNYFCHCGE